MAGDVVEGFNALLAGQAAVGHDARMTFVQFDGHNPHESLADAIPIAEVTPRRTVALVGGAATVCGAAALARRALTT